MKILVIGGSGNISWNCVNELVNEKHDVWVINRRYTVCTRRSIDDLGIHLLQTDIRNENAVMEILKNNCFDVVLDFICYCEEDARMDIRLFKNRTKQFFFVSSAANYDRKLIKGKITENSILGAEEWEYVKNKIACEKVFLKEWHESGFPVTVIRPGHTYDTLLPEAVGNGDWTNAKRILEGKPIIVHDEGKNIWTLTHGRDFAKAIPTLLLNEKTYGECYHITSDEHLNWNEITEIVANALGKSKPEIVYISSNKIKECDYELGIGIVEHKMWDDVYDNSKIREITGGWRAVIDAEEGIYQTINWLREDTRRQRVNIKLDTVISKLCKKF